MGAAGWRPTTAFVRAATCSLVFALIAVIAGRPDLVVFVAPLAIHTLWAVLGRPRHEPEVHTQFVHERLREGEGTLARTVVTGAGDAEAALSALRPHPGIGFDARLGIQSSYVDGEHRGDTVTVDVPVRALRWGRHEVGDGLAAVLTPWAGFRYGPVRTDTTPLMVLPMPGRFDARAPAPHPIGLVGVHPSTRPGDGSEFASIRPFQVGDRLKRIQWPVSLRTGRLHVTTTVAEQDASILLVVDAVNDVAAPADDLGDVGGASSLDITVRAAAAVAEHYLRRGDRVGMRAFGSTGGSLVGMGSGKPQVRRILHALTAIDPGSAAPPEVGRLRFGVGAGAVVVVFSPLLSPEVVAATVGLARRGLTVIVVDALPADPGRSSDRRMATAWRIRLLEREGMVRHLRVAGIPVVAWRGPRTLDEVLRKLGRRATMPRVARR